MTTLRATVAGIVMLLAACITVMNWGRVVASEINRSKGVDKHYSTVPVISVILAGMVAYPLYPFTPKGWIGLIPLLDIGTWMWLNDLMGAVAHRAFEKKSPNRSVYATPETSPVMLDVGRRDMEERYPAWLCSAIVENTLPWQHGKTMTLADLRAKKYTLHDSYWIALFQDVRFGGDVIMAFEWYLGWTPEGIQRQVVFDYLSDTWGWPFLFLRFTMVEGTETMGHNGVDFHDGVAYVEEEDVDGVHIFSVNDFFGGAVWVRYKGEMHVLVLDRNGKHIEI